MSKVNNLTCVFFECEYIDVKRHMVVVLLSIGFLHE